MSRAVHKTLGNFGQHVPFLLAFIIPTNLFLLFNFFCFKAKSPMPNYKKPEKNRILLIKKSLEHLVDSPSFAFEPWSPVMVNFLIYACEIHALH